jgi:hypothetical protein
MSFLERLKRRQREEKPEDWDWAWKIINREELAEEIGEEMARVLYRFPQIRPPLVAPPKIVLPITFPETALRFLKPHQYLTVPTNSTKKVYFYKLPGDHRGVIQRVGNTFYAETKATWRVDGKEVYGQSIEREIANINNPLELRPPIPVTDRIEWIVKNESGEFDREYHVICDGISCHKSEYDLLLSWLKA